ncbi:SDR family oxidoreductase [Thalassiella azotivora]
MARVFIVGGHGKIGRLLTEQLVAAGDTPVGVVRREEQCQTLRGLGGDAVLLDIEADGPDAFAAAFEGADAVVFAAGAGPDGKVERKKTVDLGGSLLSVQAAERAGVRRFVQVSAIGVDEPVPDDTEEVWKAYVAAKRDADTNLRSSSLDWTIVRPGALTDDPGTGRVELAERVERGSVPRADVAAVVAACLCDPRTVGQQWELVSGEHGIAEAVDAALSR